MIKVYIEQISSDFFFSAKLSGRYRSIRSQIFSELSRCYDCDLRTVQLQSWISHVRAGSHNEFLTPNNSQWPTISLYIFTFFLNVSLKYSLDTAHQWKNPILPAFNLPPHTASVAGKQSETHGFIPRGEKCTCSLQSHQLASLCPPLWFMFPLQHGLKLNFFIW